MVLLQETIEAIIFEVDESLHRLFPAYLTRQLGIRRGTEALRKGKTQGRFPNSLFELSRTNPMISGPAELKRKIMRQDEVLHVYGVSRNALIHMMQAEGMPQPIKLSPRRKGWFVHELDEYFAHRPRGIHPTKS